MEMRKAFLVTAEEKHSKVLFNQLMEGSESSGGCWGGERFHVPFSFCPQKAHSAESRW